MQTGDTVLVENLDGETAEGEIVAILADSLDERDASWWDDGRTLWDYWRGTDNVSPDSPVVQVNLGGTIYDYPADRVEVVDEVEEVTE